MIILLAAMLLSNAGAEPVSLKAIWKPYQYAGPDFRRYDCGPALGALDALLTAVDAKLVRKSCSWNYGLSGSWRTLVPLKADAPAQRVRTFIGTLSGDWLRNLGERWRDDSVDAQWVQAQLQVSPGPGRACQVYSEVLDYLLQTLPLRQVSLQVICDGGSGMISAGFEYLAVAGSGGRPSR